MQSNRPGPTALASLVALIAVSQLQAGKESRAAVKSIDVAAASEYVLQHDDAVILDVRTPVEFEQSHITGAINVNVQGDDFASLASGLDKNKTYVVHCTRNPGNGRSSRALEILASLGFRNLMSLEGGYVAWKEAELPLSGAEP